MCNNKIHKLAPSACHWSYIRNSVMHCIWKNIKTFTHLKSSSNGSLSALAATFKWHQLLLLLCHLTLRSFLVHINKCRTIFT